MLSLAACDNSNGNLSGKNANGGVVGSDGNNSNGTGNSSGITLSSDAIANLEPIEILAKSTDEIKGIIDAQSNLKAADYIKINVPESAVVLKYDSRLYDTTPPDFKEYYDNFVKMFEYYYPDKTLNDEYLFYAGESSDTEYDDETLVRTKGYDKVKDRYDDLMSGAEKYAYIFYDETYCRDVTEWDSQVALRGNDEFVAFNKGKTVSLAYKTTRNIYGEIVPSTKYPELDGYSPEMHLEFVGQYSPDSEESFKLSDKETSIKDATEFYVNYVENLTYPKKENFDVTVKNVDVYKVNADTYGYQFNMTHNYNGIDFYWAPSNIYRSSDADIGEVEHYQGSRESGFMVESNAVDIVFSHYGSQMVENAQNIEKIVSFEDIMKKVSDNLSDEVVFEVYDVNLCYIRKFDKDALGGIDISTYGCDVYPIWNFVLYNPNDGLNYELKIRADNAEEFSYEVFSLTDSVNN
jgi:hypothetical protein